MTLFPHPLWHGTSAHLLPMIEEHGLGGRNVMAEWRVMDFLAEVFPRLNYNPVDYDDPDHNKKMLINACLGQTNRAMNFQYGHLYVAGGYERAASYASYAPELISYVFWSLDMADRYGLPTIKDSLSAYPEIAAFVEQPPQPVVLKLPLVPLSALEDEKGGPIMESLLEGGQVSEALLPQTSFRLNAVIPLGDIEVIALAT